MLRRFAAIVIVFGILVVALGCLSQAPPAPVVEVSAAQKDPPRLVVQLVFDQLRGDYLSRWEKLFGEGGFRRLQQDGAWFTNCHYPYAYTLTAPGHASMATGCSPQKHGIVANNWFDRAHGETISSVTPPPEDRGKGLGPYRRLQETAGDVLLRTHKGKARVASLSIKDRAAILLAALRAQICYWIDVSRGGFATSRHYRAEPHSWVTAFNRTKPLDRWQGKSWERFRAGLDYAKHSGPDAFLAEGIGYKQGFAFPHPYKVEEEPDSKLNASERKAEALGSYYDAVLNSPAGNELLLELAKKAIDAEKLGQGETIDLLCLSFSSNDLVGHCWGPDSQEVLDMTLRTDALIKDLLDHLDAKVGRGRYTVVLCADHGVCPLPELARRQGKEARRVDPEVLTTRAEAFLNRAFLPEGARAPWLERTKHNSWIYLNRALLKELNIAPEKAERTLAEWLAKQEGIEAAITRSELLAGKVMGKHGEAVRRSFHPDGSGDVLAILKPYHLFSPPILGESAKSIAAYRTTHGTPHPYDTHVPLLVYGPRVRAGRRDERVTPQAVAAILAAALGVERPRGAEAPVPSGLFGE